MGKMLTCSVVAVSVAGSLAGAAGAQQPAQRSVFERYTEPIEIYKTGLGTFTRPISSSNKEAQAFFDQGFQMMYAFAKPRGGAVVPRVLEARSRLRDLLLGRSVGVGLVPERADDRARRRRTPTRRSRRRWRSRRTPTRRSARSSTRWPCATSRSSIPRSGSSRTRPTRRRWSRSPERIRTISTSRRCMPTRCSCSSRAAARATSNSPSVQRLHHVLEQILAKDVHHPGACHLYVHATESTVVPGRAEACAEFLGRSIPGASHINHMPSHTWNEIGRWGDSVRANIEAWHSDLKARGRRGLRDLPRAQPAHAAVCRVDGRAGRDRDPGGEGLREADRRQLLSRADAGPVRPLRRSARGDEPPSDELPGGLWDFAQGYAHLRQGAPDFAKVYLGARQEGGRDVEGGVPRAQREEPARHGRRHSRRGDPARRRRSERRDRGVREAPWSSRTR